MAENIELERLYDDHGQALFAFLLNLLRSDADARDVLQGMFVKLAREPRLMQPVREPRAFLLRLAHNAAIDLIRRTGARERAGDLLKESTSGLFASSDDPDAASFRKGLETALKELPAEQRTVVHLKLWEGLTFERIAEILHIPLNTAASRYRYGLDKLRHRLRPLYEEIK